MDSGACTDQSTIAIDVPHKSSKAPEDVSVSRGNEDAVEPPSLVHGAASLGPITPDSNKESGDFPLDSCSPLTVSKALPEMSSFLSKENKKDKPLACDLDDHSSPRTPKHGVFDPFAPGPDDKALAPLGKKYVDQIRSSVARRLNFNSAVKSFEERISSCDVESISDEEMVESVYENLLEAIVSNQAEAVLHQLPYTEWDSDDCKTPPLVPRLNGIAETCPGAPMKPTWKSRKIDLELCRKLEF